MLAQQHKYELVVRAMQSENQGLKSVPPRWVLAPLYVNDINYVDRKFLTFQLKADDENWQSADHRTHD